MTSWLQDCLRYPSIFDTSLGDISSVLSPILETGQVIITLVAHWSIIIFFDVSRSRLGIRSVVTPVSPYSVVVPTQCRFRSTSINRLVVTFLLRSEMIVLNAILFFFFRTCLLFYIAFLAISFCFGKYIMGLPYTTHQTLVFLHRRTMSVQSIPILIAVGNTSYSHDRLSLSWYVCVIICDKCSVCCVISVELMLFLCLLMFLCLWSRKLEVARKILFVIIPDFYRTPLVWIWKKNGKILGMTHQNYPFNLSPAILLPTSYPRR